MLLNPLLVLGLVSLTAAAPHLHLRLENKVGARGGELAERGITYASRKLQRRKNQEITITQLQEEILTNSQMSSEVELVQLIQETVIVIDQTKENKDNIRKNHFRNVNNNVNTILIIVTEVIDQRNSQNVNTRYMARQIQSNSQSSRKVMAMIQESQQLIIGGNGANSNLNNVSATPAGVASAQSSAAAQVNPNVVTMDPNATPELSNATMLLPAGIPQPNFGGLQAIQDPAIIIEPNQQVFVDFVNQQQEQASIINISG